MSNKAFRKDAEVKLTSPENLKTYIKVTSPGLWAVVIAAVILFAGLYLGQMDYIVDGVALVNDKKMDLIIDAKDLDVLEYGLPVFGLGISYNLPEMDEQYVVIPADKLSEPVREIGKFSDSDWVCYIEDDIDLPENVYPITINIPNTDPISNLFKHKGK